MALIRACASEVKIDLHTRWAVGSLILSIAEWDDTEDLAILRQKIVDALRIASSLIGIEDAQIVKVIAHAIGKRAAGMGGTALGAVVLKTEQLANTESFRQSKHSLEIDGEDQPKKSNVANQMAEGGTAKDSIPSLSSDEPCFVDVFSHQPISQLQLSSHKASITSLTCRTVPLVTSDVCLTPQPMLWGPPIPELIFIVRIKRTPIKYKRFPSLHVCRGILIPDIPVYEARFEISTLALQTP